MKNIFVIPTIEPSQVYLIKIENALGLTTKNPESMKHYGSGTHNQHVYITNKEPYDRGDWCIDIEAGEIFKVAEVKEFSGIVRSDTNTYVYDACVKIVITTDPKLVSDGISEIGIEFLRLLKDKKLDEISTVEVEKTPLLSNNGRALYGYDYKAIILSQEEPKHPKVLSESGNELFFDRKAYLIKEEPKQEWKPKEGEEVWIKVFSNWSSGKYIGYDVDKEVHLVREPKEGGGHLFSSNLILSYSDMPNEPKEALRKSLKKSLDEKNLKQEPCDNCNNDICCCRIITQTLEEYFLDKMKEVLLFDNDAQAIRFMEKYYQSKKEQDGK